jgi:hypothetical protein
MARYQPGNCPECRRPVAAKAGHPPPKCLDCAMIGIDPPAPSGHRTTPQAAQGVADRMKELEAQRDEAIEQRDALAASVERLNNKLGDIKDQLYGRNLHVAGWHLNGDLEPMDAWFKDNDWEPESEPTTSLTRLKAEWQAEVLERCAKGVAACKPGATPRGISIAIKMEAEELRRQAEGGE